MAKKIEGYIKLNIPAGAANPSPPVGPALGQRGVNIMEFCKAFNASTDSLEKNMPIPVVITVFSDKNNVSDHYVQNASFFRMDNITVGYTIDNFIDNYPLRLYLTGDNLFTITKYNGIDPEITGGIDSNFYPRARTIAFGLDLNF